MTRAETRENLTRLQLMRPDQLARNAAFVLKVTAAAQKYLTTDSKKGDRRIDNNRQPI